MSSFNRIERFSGNKGPGRPGHSTRSRSGTAIGSLQPFLETAADKHEREQFNALMAEIDRWGEQLCGNPGPGTLKGFRDAVRRFTESALRRTYIIREESFFDRSGRYKVLTIVERIDKELERLTAAALDQEVNKPEIRVIVEQLKGILVDLVG